MNEYLEVVGIGGNGWVGGLPNPRTISPVRTASWEYARYTFPVRFGVEGANGEMITSYMNKRLLGDYITS